MTQECMEMTPKLASQCCAPVDDLLDPEFFKALGDPTRGQLLSCLIKCGRACSVTQIAECCAVDISVVSRHLATLARVGLLDSTKRGRTMYYGVRVEHFCTRLRALADAVEGSRLDPASVACCPPNTQGDADERS